MALQGWNITGCKTKSSNCFHLKKLFQLQNTELKKLIPSGFLKFSEQLLPLYVIDFLTVLYLVFKWVILRFKKKFENLFCHYILIK